MRSYRKLALAGVSLFSLTAAPVWAQDRAADDEAKDEIVVTGTLVRGTEPVGSNVVGLSDEDVDATGASTTAQLLETIPQFGSFNNLQFPAGNGNFSTTNRPNLRNLPGFTTAGGSTTLLLMDGHRMVGMGIRATTPDPDVIPPGAIERVELVADGGSAIYGSDAVAGVINFITRKGFDGFEVGGHYGFADNYQTFDANATVGTEWDTGSVFASYNYSQHDDIFGRDRDYVYQPLSTITGVAFPVTSVQCPVGTVVAANIATNAFIGVAKLPYTSPAVPFNTANQCDPSDNAAIYPKDHRHSAMVGLTQELGDRVEVSLRGNYMNRQSDIAVGQFLVTQQIVSSPFINPALVTSPFYASHAMGGGFLEAHNISFAFGNQNHQTVGLETWSTAADAKVDLGSSWQLRLLGSYGESWTESHAPGFSNATFVNAIRAGLFNPYDAPSSNPAGLAAVLNSEELGLANQDLLNFRAVFDGDLFQMPAGAVKLAIGAEYLREGLDVQKGNTVPGAHNTGYAGLTIGANVIVAPQAPLKHPDLGRNVKSAFGELVIPLFNEDNSGLNELSISLSGRYDDYSDVGGTFNPKIGATLKPFDWFKLRGSWGESFNAPSLADDPAAELVSVSFVQGLSFLLPPASLQTPAGGPYPVPGAAQFVVVVQGNRPGITPQTSTNLSVGFDIEPPVIPNLNLSLTYFKLDITGLIGLPPFTNPAVYYKDFGSLITVNPSVAALNALVASADLVGGGCATAGCAYAILDIRKTNLAQKKLNGLDFAVTYNYDIGFADLDFSFAGSYDMDSLQAAGPGLALVDQTQFNNSRLRYRTAIGAQTGNLYSQVSLNHTNGYDLNPTQGIASQVQTAVDPYNVANLFFRYDVTADGLLHDLSLTLIVNNLFDTDPPNYRGLPPGTRNNVGFINGATLGRLIQFGVEKKF